MIGWIFSSSHLAQKLSTMGHEIVGIDNMIGGYEDNIPQNITIYKKNRPREVKHATCSADKVRKLLNYKTSTDLNTGIKKTFEYIKKRGTKPFNYHIKIEIKNELTPETWLKREI